MYAKHFDCVSLPPLSPKESHHFKIKAPGNSKCNACDDHSITSLFECQTFCQKFFFIIWFLPSFLNTKQMESILLLAYSKVLIKPHGTIIVLIRHSYVTDSQMSLLASFFPTSRGHLPRARAREAVSPL